MIPLDISVLYIIQSDEYANDLHRITAVEQWTLDI